ncbi:MAG: Chromosome partition protein Smc [Mycoplasmataceae bacterium]|nr:MAG: Chromosome partition protein Smc [Mycoplasmataceae bacterium]
MTKNEQLQQELKETLKEGVKPSDLKKKKKFRIMTNNEDPLKIIERLEQEKSQYLAIIENYEREQAIAVGAFKEKEKVINEKNQQLSDKDEEVSNLNEQISQLKTRINQIFQEKKELRKLLKDNNITISEELETNNIGIQTDFLADDKEFVELFETKLVNISDFTDYRQKLAEKTQIIADLETKIKNLLAQPDHNKKRALILGVIALINGLLLIFK